jgi:hypothetical protein
MIPTHRTTGSATALEPELERLERQVAALLARRGGHVHRGRPDGCAEPGCWGLHPAVALARRHEAAARLARRSLAHVHTFEAGACSGCGQLLMREVA